MDRSEPSGREERLFEVLLDYLESSERGLPPDSEAFVARHPELAPELQEFLDTYCQLETWTEPVRSMSRIIREAVHSEPLPAPENAPTVTADEPARAAAGTDTGAANGPGGPSAEVPPGEELARWPGAGRPSASERFPFQVDPAPHREIGRLGSYRLLEVVGSGGMGIVFRAEDILLHRPAAVKVLRPELAVDPGARQRFLREARLAAALTHEHVVTVYQVGEDAGVAFLAMQWLTGQSLEAVLRRAGGPLEVLDVLRVGRQAASGLAAAHARGFLHRDMKPANLWLETPAPRSSAVGGERDAVTAGRVKLLDFGLARESADEENLTKSGLLVGTPAYMSPEQAAGKALDPRSDLFSLGVILYRMLTGRPPFGGRGAASPDWSSAEPPRPVCELNPATPPELNELVMSLLSADPSARPATADAVASRLEAIADRTRATPSPERVAGPSPARVARPRGVTRRWQLAAAAALAILLPLGYLFGGVIVRFATNRGEVVIAVDDPDVGVSVRAGGVVLEDRKGKQRITLDAGEHELEVTVRGAGGESHFFTKKFVLRRGGREVINVSRELASATAQAGGSSAADRAAKQTTGVGDAAAASRVLALGGRVRVRSGDRTLDLRDAKELPAGHIRLVSADLAGARVGDADLEWLDAVNDLTGLRLGHTQVGDAGLARLSGMKGLRTLDLSATAVTDAGLVNLRPLADLRELDLSRTAIGDGGLAHLESLKNLQILNLVATRLSDAGLVHVGPLLKLRELYLSDMPVTDAGLAHLRALAELELLHLNNARITDAGLAHLTGLKRLRFLNIPGTAVTDAGLTHLQALTELEQVALDSTRITDAGLPKLAALKKLRAINLGNPGVTDAGMEAVGALTTLRELGLFGCRVTDAGLAKLEPLTLLEAVNLSGLPVTEVGLAHLARAGGLHRLEVSRTRVRDRSIKAIISLNWPLKYLGLRETRLSGKGFAHIKTAYPGAEIPWSEPNRTAAESVLAAGGTVRVRRGPGEEGRTVKAAADLPAEYFAVTGYRLPRQGKVPDDLPRLLAALTDPEFDGLEAVDFSGGPCDLHLLKDLLPKTVRDLTLVDTRVGDDDLRELQSFRIRRLNLEGCPVSGAGLAHLKSSPAAELTELSLARTQFSDARVAHLRVLPKLRKLDLSGCAVRGPGLTDLKTLPELREITLACPTLTDLFAEELSGLTQIERLSLAGSGLTDEGLKHLRGLTGLRHLDLTATKVTAAGVAALRKELPHCDVQSGSPPAH